MSRLARSMMRVCWVRCDGLIDLVPDECDEASDFSQLWLLVVEDDLQFVFRESVVNCASVSFFDGFEDLPCCCESVEYLKRFHASPSEWWTEFVDCFSQGLERVSVTLARLVAGDFVSAPEPDVA